MSSCLLGFIGPCDRIDNPPDLTPDTIINILMFHFRLVDINRNPIDRAAVKIVSRSLNKKDGTDKVMYNQETDVDVYPPDFGVPGNFQPYDVSGVKI